MDPQDAARLLVVHADGRLIDASVRDLPRYLEAGDRMVFNDTRVIPAALKGIRAARDELGRGVVPDVGDLLEVRVPTRELGREEACVLGVEVVGGKGSRGERNEGQQERQRHGGGKGVRTRLVGSALRRFPIERAAPQAPN